MEHISESNENGKTATNLGSHQQEIVIRPLSGSNRINLKEIYQFRHMLFSMVWRNIRVQFDDLSLGVFWACARPLLMVLVFTLLKRFSNANFQYPTIPYELYTYSGLIFWFYFIEAIQGASTSITRDAGLIKKIYFPRLITPMIPISSGVYSLGIGIIPLIILMIWNGVWPDFKLLLLPVVLFSCMVFTLGVGCFFAAISLKSKDYERFLNLILYVGMFVSPVIYAPSMIPNNIRLIYFMNPMAGFLLAFRSCFFAEFPFPVIHFLYSCGISFAGLIIGTWMFRKAEIHFSDKL
jgi:lipopolysaccharide transport system permease protein